MSNDLLTAQEVADIIKVKKNTVYEMIKRGEIPSRKIGKQLRISSRDIERYFETAEKPSPAAQPAQRPPVYSAPRQDSIVLCGQDISLDIIANYCSSVANMPAVLRSQSGSYNSLYQLYQGKVNIATAHLWDEKAKEYNISYISRLIPGIPVIAIRLFGRRIGFYVRGGNPKGITGWEDLKRPDICIVNREKGSGTRVLLDEKLKLLHINRFSVEGYQNEHTSHLSVAGAILRGEADVGMGIERVADQAQNIEFIPLQKEWYDMVFFADQEDDAVYRVIVDYVSSEKFMMEIAQIGDYDFSQTGRIHRL